MPRPRPALPRIAPPRCIKCGTEMAPSDAKPNQAYGYRFERRTFACPKCKHAQTYTMGLNK